MVTQAKELLHQRQLEKERVENLAAMRELASMLLSVLAELEAELKSDVDTPASDLALRTRRVLQRADGFLQDERPRDDGDVQKVARRAAQVLQYYFRCCCCCCCCCRGVDLLLLLLLVS